MTTDKDHGARRAIVARVINACDPYGLLSLGAPADKYDTEIDDIVVASASIRSVGDAAALISRVFIKWFSDEAEFSIENCQRPGQMLYAALLAEGLIPTAD